MEERTKIFLQRQDLKIGRTGKKTTTTQTRKTILQKENQFRTTITEEEDEEKHLNSTQNSLDDTELSVLISTITGDMDDYVWINSKPTMAIKLQAEINLKKEVLPLEEQVPKEFHEYLDIDAQRALLAPENCISRFFNV